MTAGPGQSKTTAPDEKGGRRVVPELWDEGSPRPHLSMAGSPPGVRSERRHRHLPAPALKVTLSLWAPLGARALRAELGGARVGARADQGAAGASGGQGARGSSSTSGGMGIPP